MARCRWPCGYILLLSLWVTSSIAQSALDGAVNLYVFDKDIPAQNLVVTFSDGYQGKLDEGGIRRNMPAGQYNAKIFQSKDESIPIQFNIVAGEETTLYLTLVDKKVHMHDSVQSSPLVLKDSLNSSGSRGILHGVVKSSKKKSSIDKVKIIIHGDTKEYYTDKNGAYTISLPVGKYTVSFIHPNYTTKTEDSIEIVSEQTYNNDVILSLSGLELEEFLVISPSLKSSVSALLEVRKSQQTVADLIGAEQISRSGDSDAGSSLKRVTGLSLVDGKYIYVRGLGERYSSTLLNGSMIPSPDPSRRVVPLDLFPSTVIESMIVQKGYHPSMPGEFGGGVIDIMTKSLPSKRYLKFSTSYSFQGTGDALSYQGGKSDWYGVDDGGRDMPSEIASYLSDDVNISSLDQASRKSLGTKISKNYNTYSYSKDHLPIPSLSIGYGNRFRLRKLKIGYDVSFLYSNKWSFDEESQTSYDQSGSELIEDASALKKKSKNRVKFATMFGTGVKYKRHKLTYNFAYLQSTSKYVNYSTGLNSEDEQYRKTELGWNRRVLRIHQVSGESSFRALNNLKLKWNLSDSKATLDAPDNKMYVYKLQAGTYQMETENGSAGNYVFWHYMPDHMKTVSISLDLPIALSSFGTAHWTLGATKMERDRKFDSSTFYYKFDSGDPVDPTENPDNVFSHSGAELYQQSSETDNYSSSQTIDAYYTNASLSLPSLSASVGVRFEKSKQSVDSFKLFNSGTTNSTLLTEDYFPAVSLTYKISHKLQLRFNGSETVSRPDLREISKTTWNDIDQGAKFQGNPNLQAAIIRNYDLRLEWFFNRGELISLGGFYKNFTNPIEEIFGSLAEDGSLVSTSETKYTYLNVGSAQAKGIEFELRYRLGDGFLFGGNYSYIDSSVEISADRAGQLTTLKRSLQGQSTNLANLYLEYEYPKRKLIVTLLYNSIGKMIKAVGVNGRPDEYQGKIASLDLVAGMQVYNNWKLSLKLKNLLDPLKERMQGGYVTRSIQSGREFSIGLSGRW